MIRMAPTVLYVEDEPVNVLVMEELFHRLPEVRLAVARSGAEAWAVAATLDPALLLLDIALPDCRGNDLLRRLRVLPGCYSVRAVAVTTECCFDALAHGFDERWAKPLEVGDVLPRLQALLRANVPARGVPDQHFTADVTEASQPSRRPRIWNQRHIRAGSHRFGELR